MTTFEKWRRLNGIQEVTGSIPVRSTIFYKCVIVRRCPDGVSCAAGQKKRLSRTDPRPERRSVAPTNPALASAGLAGLPTLADDGVVVSRRVDVDQAAFIIDGHVHEPIAPVVNYGSRTQCERRAAKGVEHGTVK